MNHCLPFVFFMFLVVSLASAGSAAGEDGDAGASGSAEAGTAVSAPPPSSPPSLEGRGEARGGSPAAEYPASPPVDQLVQQLDAPRLADRQAAEAALIERGPAVLKLLPGPQTVESAEVRVRLQRIRRRLNQAAAEGAFQPPKVSVVDVTIRRPPGPNHGGLVRIELRAAWKPPVRIITLRQAMADVEAVDDRGRPLPVSDPEAVREVILDEPQQSATLPVVLKLPPSKRGEADGVRVAKLSGRMSAVFLGPEQAFRFTDPADAAGTRNRLGEAVVALERFGRKGPTWEARIRVTFDEPGRALASHRGWFFRSRAVLELPDGERLEPVATETYLRTRQAAGVGYRFDAGRLPQGTTLIYRTPTRILTRPVPYCVENPHPHGATTKGAETSGQE